MAAIEVRSRIPSTNLRDDRSQLDTWQAGVNYFLAFRHRMTQSLLRVHVAQLSMSFLLMLATNTDVDHRSALARFHNLAKTVPWIKVIITSRRKSDIADIPANDSIIYYIDVNAVEWDTSTDIRFFIQNSSRVLNLSPDQVGRFQENVSGLFICCTTSSSISKKTWKADWTVFSKRSQQTQGISSMSPFIS